MHRDHDPERIDLAPLDPSADPARWARLLRAISQAATPELERRAAAAGALAQVARWAVPVLPLAAALAALSVAGLALSRATNPAQEPRPVLVEALDVRPPVSLWLAEGRPPASSDLVLALEEEAP